MENASDCLCLVYIYLMNNSMLEYLNVMCWKCLKHHLHNKQKTQTFVIIFFFIGRFQYIGPSFIKQGTLERHLFHYITCQEKQCFENPSSV